MKRWVLLITRTVALTYGVLLLLVAIFQRSMIYFPTRVAEADLLNDAHNESLQPWRDATGQLIGFHQAAPNAPRRIVVFHGNAGQALDRVFYADSLGGLGWEVYLLEYPGYGARPGSPSKDAFISTGRAAVEALLAADPRPVYLLGESIGSGPACAIAGQLPDRIAGVMLMLPFARLAEVAKARFFFLPIDLLLRDKFDNLAALSNYHGPVAVVVAEKDEVIGVAQGRKLHAAYTGPKHLCELPNCGHNDFPTSRYEKWWGEVTEFLAEKR